MSATVIERLKHHASRHDHERTNRGAFIRTRFGISVFSHGCQPLILMRARVM